LLYREFWLNYRRTPLYSRKNYDSGQAFLIFVLLSNHPLEIANRTVFDSYPLKNIPKSNFNKTKSLSKIR
jgi:hypothetical protein